MDASNSKKFAAKVNHIYWDLHSLLHGAEVSAMEFGEDAIELRHLIDMASRKALELNSCCESYLAHAVKRRFKKEKAS